MNGWWEHEGEGWRDHARYLWCRIVGHRPVKAYFNDDWHCRRCGDVLPRGNQRRQP